MKHIPLTKGQFALVDDEDFDWLNKYSWQLATGTYAVHNAMIKGKKKNTSMHRMILDAKPVQTIDHINHNKLDNQRHNLRFVDSTQNGLNRKKQIKKSSSIYKGVSIYKDARFKKTPIGWRAGIMIKGKAKFLGIFKTEKEAARAYDTVAYAFDPIHCLLNFPEIISS